MAGSWVECSTREQVDAAVAAGDFPVVRAGYWEFSDNATARLFGNASASLSGNASASLFSNASARLSGNASARLYDNATASLFDNASARLSGNASASLFGNASARLFDNASARLSDNATARLFGNASASLSGNASASLFGNASARATKRVAIHRMSATAKVAGGVVIDCVPPRTLPEWLDYHDVKVTRGSVVLFKAVNGNLRSGHGWEYPVGGVVEPAVWKGDGRCGNGLHLCASPHEASRYMEEAVRWLACRVRVADLDLIDQDPWDKVKARKLVVLREVDVHGDPIAVAS